MLGLSVNERAIQKEIGASNPNSDKAQECLTGSGDAVLLAQVLGLCGGIPGAFEASGMVKREACSKGIHGKQVWL